MEVLGTPVVTFSALCLMLMLSVSGLFLVRARMLRLERQLLDMQDGNQGMMMAMQEVLLESLSRLEDGGRGDLEELKKRILNEFVAFKGELSGLVNNTGKDLDASLSGLIKDIASQSNESISSVSRGLEKTTESVKNNATYMKGIVERMAVAISKEINKSESAISVRLEQLEQESSQTGSTILSQLESTKKETLDRLAEASNSQIQKISTRISESSENTRNELQDTEERLADVIDRLRVSNIQTENKNLYDQGRLVIETDAFVKTFDHCQLTQLEDKETGLVTKNEYKDGLLAESRTYRTDSLEYIGHYQNGVLLKMEDHTGPEGSVTQYEYNEAGEVESIE